MMQLFRLNSVMMLVLLAGNCSRCRFHYFLALTAEMNQTIPTAFEYHHTAESTDNANQPPTQNFDS